MVPVLSSVGRVAVVSGANKGIGYFIALQLAMSGLFQHVWLACRDMDRAQEAVSSIQAQLPSNLRETVSIGCSRLIVGDDESHKELARTLDKQFGGKIDVLINNAAMAYKSNDPTPFKVQCSPTINVNFRGTCHLTEQLIPLLRKGTDARVVTVASQSGWLGQISPERQEQFTDPNLTMDQLYELVNEFERQVLEGTHKEHGWGNSNYGMSKLAIIAATKVWARLYSNQIVFNCCCPGYCRTDMTSQKGPREPSEGARNAVIPSTMTDPPTGEYFANFQIAKW